MFEPERNVTQIRRRRPSRDEVRERLIAGAMTTFAERGFAGASIDFICACAGFSRGAFYSNFADKDALFFALYDQRAARLSARVQALSERALAAGDPMAELAQALARPDRDELHWDILNKEFIVHALRNEAARARLIESRAHSRAQLRAALGRLLPGWSLDDPRLETLARFVVALHEGELTQLGIEPELAAGDTLESRFIPLVIDALRRQDTAVGAGAGTRDMAPRQP